MQLLQYMRTMYNCRMFGLGDLKIGYGLPDFKFFGWVILFPQGGRNAPPAACSQSIPVLGRGHS